MRRDSAPAVTVPAFLAALRAGALAEGPRAELIDGRVVPGSTPGPGEMALLAHLLAALGSERVRQAGGEPVPNAPFRLSPGDLLRADLALLPSPEGAPRGRRVVAPVVIGVGGSFEPSAALVVIEVARSRASTADRLALYAAGGVREVWLLDVARGWTEVLRSPWRGTYRSRTLWYPGEALRIEALGGVEVTPMPSP